MVKTELNITIQEFSNLQKCVKYPIRITSVSTFKEIRALKNKGELKFEEHIRTNPLVLDVESVQYIYNYLFDKDLFILLEDNRKQQRRVLE